MSAVQPPKSYLLGEFEFSPSTLDLSRGGSRIHLTHKPFQVLLYLVEHRERVVSRAELLERFWEGHEVYDETLTKSIGAIRKALSDTSDHPRFIATHWAEGYRYIGPCEELPSEQPPETVVAQPIAIFDSGENDLGGPEIPHPPEAPTWIPVAAGKTPVVRAAIIVTASLVVLLLAGALFRMQQGARGDTSAPPRPIRSIAVLPFKNLTNDPAQEYFTDGITESFITALSRIEDLKVISRSSVFTFKGKDIDIRDAGSRLGVEGIIEGRVRQEGDTMRVAVQLVSTSDGSVLWSRETYKRGSQDIFSLQDEIVRDVAASLRGKLSREGVERLGLHGTTDVEAYRLYLKGRHFWNKRSGEGLNRAIECFQQATERDPTYAVAYAGLADSYALLSYFTELPENETFPKARAAAQYALKLDDDLAEAHASLGLIEAWYEMNWTGAETEYKKAISISPNYATARHWYGNLLSLTARHEEGLAQLRRAQELDPLSPIISTDLGMALFFAQNYDDAALEIRKVLELDPNFITAHYFLGWVHEQKNEFTEAIAEFQKAVELSQGNALFLAMLGHSYAVSGQRIKARQTLTQLREVGRRKPISPANEAIVRLGLGQREEGLALLEKAGQARDVRLADLKVSPIYATLHSDPRFQDLLRRVGLGS